MANQTEQKFELRGKNAAAYEVAQKHLDIPMSILAILLGIIIAFQILANPSDSTDATLESVSWLIWAAFVLEYLVLFWLAPNRRQMVATHKLDLFLIVVPFLRPLRVLRAMRAFAGFAAGLAMARRVMERRGMQWVIVAVLLILTAGASLTMIVERQDPEGTITTFGTAVWWAIVTSTTVGYGDVAPITPAGRAIAVVLMTVGVALLSLITAHVASLFVEQDENDELKAELAIMHEKLDLLLENFGSAHTYLGTKPT